MREAMDAAPDGWVIDGNYEAKLGDTLIGAADTIVWLDLPLRLKLRRLWRRTTRANPRRRRALERQPRVLAQGVLGPGVALRVDDPQTHFRHRRTWPALYGGDPRFVRLRSVAEARRWLDAQSVTAGSDTGHMAVPPRHRHAAVQRHRGLDPAACAAAARPTPSCWSATARSCARRSSATAGRCSGPRATSSSSRSSRPATPSRRPRTASARSPGTTGPTATRSACAWACTRASRAGGRHATSASTSTRRRA